jgi:glucosyl-dolichyl phosphate glucuronosyltransferase
MEQRTENFHITVAVCTWNRAHLLRKTLVRLAEVSAIAPLPWDCLVIDNNSTDETPSVVDSFAEQLPIRRVVENKPGLSNARNSALERSEGTHIVFIDDDVLVGSQWLSAVAKGIVNHPKAGAFGGPILPWFEVYPDPILRKAFPHLDMGFCGLHDDRQEGLLSENQHVFGANMGYRKDVIGATRFDPKLGASRTVGREGEEIEFLNHLREKGCAIVWLPSMTVQHYVDPSRMTLRYLCAYYEGRGQTFIRRSGVPEGKMLLGMPRWIFRKWFRKTLDMARHRVLGGDRLLYLRDLREFHYTLGMLKECRIIFRETSG